MYRTGIDIGSTTLKVILIDDDEPDKVIFRRYIRHHAQVTECLRTVLLDLKEVTGNESTGICITGSLGMGLAERLGLPFIQEVVAATNYIRRTIPEAGSMIDIGGEDAKIVFFKNGKTSEMYMNGNCAGGTGAFLDQMAALLDVPVEELDRLARNAGRKYPIASRCGVFCKTDIQNLIARNVPREDIAASIFHAVAVQTITTLSHGNAIGTPVVLSGGPFSFIPSLRKAFSEYLGIAGSGFVVPGMANLLTAYGTALSDNAQVMTVPSLEDLLKLDGQKGNTHISKELEPLFRSPSEYEEWKKEKSGKDFVIGTLRPGRCGAYIGIDSGSTTTKIVVLDEEKRMVYSYYAENCGDPAGAVRKGLEELAKECSTTGTELVFKGSCSTGYGEDLIKSAFGLESGIVETIAHQISASHLAGDVSFILDIGGQDMKAIFIDNGAVGRIEVNEACSSGCGSFISTFARSLGLSASEFAGKAILADAPCDLGTRCTVFMNSRVKQALREGAGIGNIAAGLSYSVVRNCLYKVLRIKDKSELGNKITVQGGTMRNDAVVRALEKLTGAEVFRSGHPELMGAAGCALHSMKAGGGKSITLHEMLGNAESVTDTLNCRGCGNRCTVTRHRFANGNVHYAGNRCEKVFCSSGKPAQHGVNAYDRKLELLFDRHADIPSPVATIGIPRCLGMYEEYPFWHTLFTACGVNVILSGPSDFGSYERCSSGVMSDNLCFPAKLVHAHIEDLARRRPDRIFFPFVVHEKEDKTMQNSYCCPVVTGYSQVIKSVSSLDVPVDSPTVSFKDMKALRKQCTEYLGTMGISSGTAEKAFREAVESQENFEHEMAEYDRALVEEARYKGKPIILLAGRPYHSDPLIQHGIGRMTASFGVYVITDDIVRESEAGAVRSGILTQWAYMNRILKAADWAAGENDDIQFMQVTSFGCGPDAFLVDEVQSILRRNGKNAMLLKVDDVNNTGSLRLRVRSFIESFRRGNAVSGNAGQASLPDHPIYTAAERRKKIIIPFFTPFISPLIPEIMKVAGYDVETLPMADAESVEWGLKFSNNEICFPATLIVGDIVKAFRSGRYDPENTCIAMTQTGGQCRASNYLSLIRKALDENGYARTPVISVSTGSGIGNYQPGFRVNWRKVLPVALAAILYSDAIARLYFASKVREICPGSADTLKDKYLEIAKGLIRERRSNELYVLLREAAEEFSGIIRNEERPRVGIVGEIFLKFHPFAQKNVTGWLTGKGIEAVYPSLADFFLQAFVNQKENRKRHIDKPMIPAFISNILYDLVSRKIMEVNEAAGAFPYFMKFDSVFRKAEKAEQAISLSAQFGEGWLIAGEAGMLYEAGIRHIISLQPFGCIANHIVEKGIEKRLRALYPGMNILSLDFDGSVSDVNITNRLLLFMDGMK